MIKVEDFFAQHEVFQKGRTSAAGFETVLIVCNPDTLIGGQVPALVLISAPGDLLMRFSS